MLLKVCRTLRVTAAALLTIYVSPTTRTLDATIVVLAWSSSALAYSVAAHTTLDRIPRHACASAQERTNCQLCSIFSILSPRQECGDGDAFVRCGCCSMLDAPAAQFAHAVGWVAWMVGWFGAAATALLLDGEEG